MTQYKIPEQVVVQNVSGESVLLNLDNGKYYGLDEIGTRMLELMREHGDVEQLIAPLLAEYDVSEEVLRKDLDELLAQLVDAGLVEKVD
jgi:hypothetical protein